MRQTTKREKQSSCICKDSLDNALKYLYQVLCVLSFESLTAKGTLIPSSFYGVLPSFHFLFIIATILFTVNFQSLFRWFQVQLKEKGFQSIRTLLDDKILHYEGLAFKEQPTKEEYLTMKIELPGLHVFARELENLRNELHPGVGYLPSILYKSRLKAIENAMTYHDLKLFPATICDCSGSDCWAKKECERLQGMSEEIEGFKYEFLSLACDRKKFIKEKDINAFLQKCEKFVERLSLVTSGELSNNAIRSLRNVLLTRAETLESKLAILIKEKKTSDIHAYGPANKKTVTTDKENKCPTRYGGGKYCCISGCQNGAGMHFVTELQGRYEIHPETVNEPWLLYVWWVSLY